VTATVGALQSCRLRVQPAGLFPEIDLQGRRNSSFRDKPAGPHGDLEIDLDAHLIRRGRSVATRVRSGVSGERSWSLLVETLL
jgi:hypothetical protein